MSNYNSSSTDKYILYLDSISLSRFYEILGSIDAMEISVPEDMDVLEAYERAKTQGVHISQTLPYGTELAIQDSYLHEMLSAEMKRDGFDPDKSSSDEAFSDDLDLSGDLDIMEVDDRHDISAEDIDEFIKELETIADDNSDEQDILDELIATEESSDVLTGGSDVLTGGSDKDDFGFADIDLSAFEAAEQVFSDGEETVGKTDESVFASSDLDIDFSQIDASDFDLDALEIADTAKTVTEGEEKSLSDTSSESYTQYASSEESRVISGEDVLPLIYALNAIKHSLTVGVSDTLTEMEELIAGLGVGESTAKAEEPESEEVRAFAEELAAMPGFNFEDLDSAVFGDQAEKTESASSTESSGEDFDYSAVSSIFDAENTAPEEKIPAELFDKPDPAPSAASPLSSTSKKKKGKKDKGKKGKKGKKPSPGGDIWEDYAGFIDDMINATGMSDAALADEKISAMISTFRSRLYDTSSFFSRNDMCNAVIDLISALNSFCESHGVYDIYISYPESSVSILYDEYERRYSVAASAAARAKRDLDAELEEKKRRADLLKDAYDEATPATELENPALTGEEHKFIFGASAIPDMPGNELIYQRFGYKRAYFAGEFDCDLLLDLKTGEKIGIIPRIRLSHVWDKVPFDSGSDELKCGIDKKEWDKAYSQLNAYIKKGIASDPSHPGMILVQDVLALPENIYRALFIKKATNVIELIRAAILADIAENRRLIAKWHRIKKYKKKIALSKDAGGIFSKNDVKVLEKRGIRYINDIRDYDVYTLKNLLLEHSFTNIIKEINEVYKEHKAQIKDRIYARRPYIIGYTSLILVTIIAYVMKYRLIKSARETNVINITSAIFVLCLLTAIFAIVRTFVRRRKNPSYKYLVPKVKRRLGFMVMLAVFTMGSVFVFYQRYDGYNDSFYYRDLDDGTIAVAGLVDKFDTVANIPSHIDGKTVTEIDVGAFRKKDISTAVIPDTVQKIDPLAFYKCSSLTKIEVFTDKYFDAPFDSYDSDPKIKEIGYMAFAKCERLHSAYITEGVETLGVGAFRDCVRLGEINLKTVSSFGKSAFSGCTALVIVTFGENTTSVPEAAFSGCSSLNTINGFGYVSEVSDKAFFGCLSLKSVSFDNVKSIGKSSFSGCSSLTELILPATLERVGKNAFYECNRISYVELPFIGDSRENTKNTTLNYLLDCRNDYGIKIHVVLTDMPTIVGNTFKNCAAVEKVTLPSNVTKIESGAFDGSGITEFEIPDSFTVLPENLFRGCNELVTISGGRNVTQIESGAFKNCKRLTAVDFPLVVSIGENAFSGCESLTSIGQTSSLREVAVSAFEECYSLTSIDLSSVEGALQADTFKGCNKLESVLLPETLKVLPEGIFEGCTSLKELYLPETVEVIGKHAFRDSGIKNLNIGASVVEIGAGAFLSCTQIEELVIPDTVVKIGRRAFADCYSLSRVELPFLGETRESVITGLRYVFGKDSSINDLTVSGVETLYPWTLRGAKELKTLTVNDGLKKVSWGALAYNSSLTHISLPSSLETIGRSAFANCDSLKVAELSLTKVTQIGKSAFKGCDLLNTVALPETLLAIPDSAFRGCYAISEITLPESIIEIGKNAFRDNGSLKSVVFPENLEAIGNKAFYRCNTLTSITVPEATRTIGKQILVGCTNLDSLTVPFIGKTVSEAQTIGYLTDSKSLTSITLTAASTIAENAFADCKSLITLTLNSDIRKVGSGVVSGCTRLERVIMPTEEMFQRFSRFFKGVDIYSPSGEKYLEDIEEDIWSDEGSGGVAPDDFNGGISGDGSNGGIPDDGSDDGFDDGFHNGVIPEQPLMTASSDND